MIINTSCVGNDQIIQGGLIGVLMYSNLCEMDYKALCYYAIYELITLTLHNLFIRYPLYFYYFIQTSRFYFSLLVDVVSFHFS